MVLRSIIDEAIFARLGATGLQVGLLSAGPALVNILFSLPLGRWLEDQPLVRANVLAALWSRLGYLLLLLFPVLFGQYPLLLYFARDATLFWAASVIGGVIYGVIAGGLLNRLMERVPEGDRPAHMALHNLVFNMGILGGSLIGPLLGDWIGLRDAMLVSAGLRLLAGLMMMVWG